MKKLSTLQAGTHFMYGSVEWVKLGKVVSGSVLALAAEPVCEKAFDEEKRNDWRKSSLRHWLNETFIDCLVDNGADYGAFMDWESDLTADDGMTDYGTATDRIALLSYDLYRKCREYIPRVDNWCWTLTPWTCDPSYSYYVRIVYSSGALIDLSAYYGNIGVRPLCYLKSDILVSIPGEEDDRAEDRDAIHAATVEDARAAIMDTLTEYPAEVWGDALGAAEISEEEKAKAAEG